MKMKKFEGGLSITSIHFSSPMHNHCSGGATASIMIEPQASLK
jgi:hypothetical protein